MTREELTAWATKNGWRERDGVLSLSKPAKPGRAAEPPIVRLVFKATVAQVDVRKPAGKWEKVGSAAYAAILADEDTGLPGGLGMEGLHSLRALMQENRDQAVFSGFR